MGGLQNDLCSPHNIKRHFFSIAARHVAGTLPAQAGAVALDAGLQASQILRLTRHMTFPTSSLKGAGNVPPEYASPSECGMRPQCEIRGECFRDHFWLLRFYSRIDMLAVIAIRPAISRMVNATPRATRRQTFFVWRERLLSQPFHHLRSDSIRKAKA